MDGIRQNDKVPARYAAGWQEYHAVLSSLQLPPRGPRGSKRNKARSLIVQAALHQHKYKHDKSHKRSACRLCKVNVDKWIVF